MSYWDDVVKKLWEVQAIGAFIKRYGGNLSDAFKKYKECSLKATKRCDKIVFGERFLRSSILYWLLLPLVVLFALPVLVLFFITGLFRLAVRTLVYLGVSIKCMMSSIWIAIEGLIIYLGGSGLWWFFTCNRPVTLDWFLAAINWVFDSLATLTIVVWNSILWYIHMVIPCWLTILPAFNGSRSSYFIVGMIALVAGFLFFAAGIAGMGEHCGEGVVFACLIAALLLVVGSLIPFGISSTLPDRVVGNVSRLSGYCDAGGDCMIQMGDGVQYYANGDDYIKLLSGTHTIGVVDNSGGICKNPQETNRGYSSCNRQIVDHTIFRVIS